MATGQVLGEDATALAVLRDGQMVGYRVVHGGRCLALPLLERARHGIEFFGMSQQAQTHWDNMHFQYQQGFLDEEYYRDAFAERGLMVTEIGLAPTVPARPDSQLTASGAVVVDRPTMSATATCN